MPFVSSRRSSHITPLQRNRTQKEIIITKRERKLKQRVWQASYGMTPEIGWTNTKNGAHHWNRHLGTMADGLSWCCRGFVTDCEQTSNKMMLNETRWKGRKGLYLVLPIATSLTPVPLHDISTTDLLLLHTMFFNHHMFDNSNVYFDNFGSSVNHHHMSPAVKVRPTLHLSLTTTDNNTPGNYDTHTS